MTAGEDAAQKWAELDQQIRDAGGRLHEVQREIEMLKGKQDTVAKDLSSAVGTNIREKHWLTPQGVVQVQYIGSRDVLAIIKLLKLENARG